MATASAVVPSTLSTVPTAAPAIAIATVPPTPASPAQWPLVLSENFASNVNGWNIAENPYTDEYATYKEQLAGGKFHLELKAQKSVVSKYRPKMPVVSDFNLSVDAKRVSGSEKTAQYGLYFRKDDNNNYYFFEVRDDKTFGLFLYYQSKWTTLRDYAKSDAILPGQLNRINVTAVGQHLTFSINNQPVGGFDDGRLSQGVAGVAVEVGANTEAVFEFSNFELRSPTAAASVTPTALPTQAAIATLPPQPGQSTVEARSKWHVFFSDPFITNVNNWNLSPQQPLTDDYGTSTERIGDGKFRIEKKTIRQGSRFYWPGTLRPASDFALAVDVKHLSGPADKSSYGIVYRKQGNDHYFFSINDAKQFGVILWYQGKLWALIGLTKTDAILPGAVNHLNVTAVGTHFTFSINNQLVGELNDGYLSNGIAGVWFESLANSETVIEFSNFELSVP